MFESKNKALSHSLAALFLLLGAGFALAAPAQKAPDAVFKTVDGVERSTAEFNGQPTMLFLLSTWCLSCDSGIEALYEQTDTPSIS